MTTWFPSDVDRLRRYKDEQGEGQGLWCQDEGLTVTDVHCTRGVVSGTTVRALVLGRFGQKMTK